MRRYVGKMTGYSPAQLSRVIAQYRSTSWVRLPVYPRHRFPTQYTHEDEALLAEPWDDRLNPVFARMIRCPNPHEPGPACSFVYGLSQAHGEGGASLRLRSLAKASPPRRAPVRNAQGRDCNFSAGRAGLPLVPRSPSAPLTSHQHG